MPDYIGNWNSFWDLIGPEEAALLLKELYGPAAPQAAAQCAAAARSDGRETDAQFWTSVLAELEDVAKRPGVAPRRLAAAPSSQAQLPTLLREIIIKAKSR